MNRLEGCLILLSIIALSCFFQFSPSSSNAAAENKVWLDTLDVTAVMQEWGEPHRNISVSENPLKLGGKTYKRGIGTHAKSKMKIDLGGEGVSFKAWVAVDDEVGTSPASIIFKVYGDREKLFDSGVMKPRTPPQFIDVNISNKKVLTLLVHDAGDNINFDHADWADARIEMRKDAKTSPQAIGVPREAYEILTPQPPKNPRINGPRVIGAGVERDVLYTIPTTGERPMTFSAENLPSGLVLNQDTGYISGSVKKAGSYETTISATNSLGSATERITFIIGEKLALTPPMGYNSWNCWGCQVDEAKIRAAADGMVSSGLINHGWSYINVDDCWQSERDKRTGVITANDRFPDFKGLIDYVHRKGLKFGLYTDVGPLTCAGYPASKDFEIIDARTYGQWGVDYVKVDWCHTEGMDPETAYEFFGEALRGHAERDIVYSICNWGHKEPWKWGERVGGNLWRTTGDIYDSWNSVYQIGFVKQAGLSTYAGPGHWNDPDMLVVGMVGWGIPLRKTRLSPNEQYSHISLWCLLSAPLLLGCDLSQLDDFTKNLLTNDEVLAINQDSLGNQADRVKKENGYEVWAKNLADGSKAVGIFYSAPETFDIDDVPFEAECSIEWDKLGITGAHMVRDLWRQEDVGVYDKEFNVKLSRHNVKLIKLTKSR